MSQWHVERLEPKVKWQFWMECLCSNMGWTSYSSKLTMVLIHTDNWNNLRTWEHKAVIVIILLQQAELFLTQWTFWKIACEHCIKKWKTKIKLWPMVNWKTLWLLLLQAESSAFHLVIKFKKRAPWDKELDSILFFIMFKLDYKNFVGQKALNAGQILNFLAMKMSDTTCILSMDQSISTYSNC